MISVAKTRAKTKRLSGIKNDEQLHDAVFKLLLHAIDTTNEAINAVAHPDIFNRLTITQQESVIRLADRADDLTVTTDWRERVAAALVDKYRK